MLKHLGRAVVLSGLLMATGCGTLPPGESVPVETEPQYTEVEHLKPPVTPSQPEPQPTPALTDAAQNLIKKAAVRLDMATMNRPLRYFKGHCV